MSDGGCNVSATLLTISRKRKVAERCVLPHVVTSKSLYVICGLAIRGLTRQKSGVTGPNGATVSDVTIKFGTWLQREPIERTNRSQRL